MRYVLAHKDDPNRECTRVSRPVVRRLLVERGLTLEPRITSSAASIYERERPRRTRCGCPEQPGISWPTQKASHDDTFLKRP